MNELMVAGTEIRKDEQGRYSLVDLHKAAGGLEKHAPNRWLRYSQAKDLIQELEGEDNNADLGVIITTKKRGAFVVKELVYAYAIWISPAFNLRVIRAYDAIMTGRIDELSKPLAQMERYWFERREFWPLVRPRVLAGERYRDIADDLGIRRPRVGAMVKAMASAGILDPLKVAEVQHGPARRAALRYAEQLGLLKQPTQLSLWGGQP